MAKTPAISVLGTMATAGARPLWMAQLGPLIFKCEVQLVQYSMDWFVRENLGNHGEFTIKYRGSPEVDQSLPPSRSVVDEPLQRWILKKKAVPSAGDIQHIGVYILEQHSSWKLTTLTDFSDTFWYLSLLNLVTGSSQWDGNGHRNLSLNPYGHRNPTHR